MSVKLLLFSIVTLSFSTSLQAQSWSGIISPTRAVDWSQVGVTGGVPNRTTQCGTTINPYTGTADAINNAIANCPAGQFVQLGTGTFHLSTGITWWAANPISNVTLRGGGADKTFLIFTGPAFCNGVTGLVCLAGSNSGANSEQNVCDWTSGYGQYTTTITLTSCGATTPAAGSLSNLRIGSLIVLDQADEASDTGQIWNCLVQNVCASEGSGGYARKDGTSANGIANRSQQQVVRVVGCTNSNGVCTSGTNISISPGLYMPNWSSAQKPQAWYASTYIANDGVENLSLDDGGVYVADHNVTMLNCNQCWVKGVRSLYASRSHVILEVVSHSAVVDSYFYQNISHASVSYGVEFATAGDTLVQNNVVHEVTDSSPSTTGGSQGNVAAYNYAPSTNYTVAPGWFQASYYLHASGDAFNLWEGNIGTGFNADTIHGTHHFSTLFRNYLPGWQSDCAGVPCTAQTVAINLASGSRYFNVVGNVLGTSGYHSQYECTATSTATCGNASKSIYSVGYTAQVGNLLAAITGFCITPSCASRSDYDALSSQYLMRWGNYDTVSGTRWNSAEVPSALAKFANPVPASNTLPASFYLSGKPSWWYSPAGTPPWPAIGPDVANGTIAGLAGHAYNNPAALCFANSPIDSQRGAAVRLFSASTCYTSSQSSALIAPGGMTTAVR